MTDGTRELIAKKWVQHQATQITVTTAAGGGGPYGATSSANVGALATDTSNATRLVEVYNDDGANPVHCRVFTTAATGAGTNHATLGDRAVPPKTFRVFQVPTGGQGILSCIAKTASVVISVNWGLGRR